VLTHSTHKLQPSDKTFFALLKHYCGEEMGRWHLQNKQALTHYEVSELFGNAYFKWKQEQLRQVDLGLMSGTN
jgi:hypothetical protein